MNLLVPTDRPGAMDALRDISLSQSIVNDLDTDPEHQKLAEKVNDNYAGGVSYRVPWMEDREQGIRYFEHHQWPDSFFGSNVQRIQITINRIKPIIETILGIISRTKMMVAIEGVGPEDAIKGAIFNALFEMTTRKDGAEFIMHEALKESRKTGLGVCKETWDWRLDFPFGMPRLEHIKSSDIVIQPGAMGLQYEDANWIIHEKIYDTDELKAMYPDIANMIQPDEQWLKGMGDSKPLYVTAHARRDLIRNQQGSNAGPNDPAIPAHGLNTTTLKEMWYKKFVQQLKLIALKDFDVLNLKAGREIPPEEISRLGLTKNQDYAEIPFATHQMRVARVYNDRLLSDTPSPFGHNQFPFLYFKANPRDQYTYPAGDIAYMVELQDMLNKVYSLVTDHAIRVHNSPFFIDDNFADPETMEKIKTFWNWAGAIIPRRRGAKVEQLQQTPISEGLLLIARHLSTAMDELTGVSGDRETREYAGESGKAAQERRLSADIFHQPKANPIGHALLWWSQELRMPNIQHLMRQDTMIKIDDRLAKSLAETSHGAFMEQAPTGESFYRLNRPGADEQGNVINLNDLREGAFDVKASMIADFAETKRGKAELALGLGKSNLLLPVDVLRGVDWPDPEGVVKRLDERNDLLKMGQQVAEDPVLMAIAQDPAVKADVEAYLRARIASGGSPAPPTPGVEQPLQ